MYFIYSNLNAYIITHVNILRHQLPDWAFAKAASFELVVNVY